MTKLTIAIWAENTLRAGTLCQDEGKIERQSDDLLIYEGTQAELQGFAAALRAEAEQSGGGHAAFLRRSAETIEAEL